MTILPTILPIINMLYRKRTYNNVHRKEEGMSINEARQILGVSDNASPKEINNSFKLLMKKNHPDKGGTKYLAQKIIHAKNRLLYNNK